MTCSIRPYTPADQQMWDDFVKKSKNGTFILERPYMDYHADRFEDASLIFTRDGKPYALLPANRRGDILQSHSGLTYGGLITGDGASVSGVLECFELLVKYCREMGLKQLLYKPVPRVFHRQPADEDLYALFRHDAALTARMVSTAVNLKDPLRWKTDRRAGVKKAIKNGLYCSPGGDLAAFWDILDSNLGNKYGAAPVHSLAEMQLLSSRFPDNIKLHTVHAPGGEMLAGTVLYLAGDVAHTQYISASPDGKHLGAVDLLFRNIIDTLPPNFKYLDFGTSNLEGGRILNESLIYQKEGFGARAQCYDTYTISI